LGPKEKGMYFKSLQGQDALTPSVVGNPHFRVGKGMRDGGASMQPKRGKSYYLGKDVSIWGWDHTQRK